MAKIKIEDLKCISENIDLEEYINFREYVKDHMNNPEWLGDLSKENINNLLNNNSKIWIYYLNETPVCSMMFIPADQDSLNKFDLTINYKETAEYGPIMVNPKYVGNGLQTYMLKILQEYCIKSKYKYAISTIHPDNIYSINNFFKDNFKYVGTKTLKRGIRSIYLKKFSDNI